MRTVLLALAKNVFLKHLTLAKMSESGRSLAVEYQITYFLLLTNCSLASTIIVVRLDSISCTNQI